MPPGPLPKLAHPALTQTHELSLWSIVLRDTLVVPPSEESPAAALCEMVESTMVAPLVTVTAAPNVLPDVSPVPLPVTTLEASVTEPALDRPPRWLPESVDRATVTELPASPSTPYEPLEVAVD